MSQICMCSYDNNKNKNIVQKELSKGSNTYSEKHIDLIMQNVMISLVV